MTDEIQYQIGIPESLREEAAHLYDEAFGAKLSVAVPNQSKRRALLATSLVLPFAVVAITRGHLVGLAGFHTLQGALTNDMTVTKLFQQTGLLGGARATLVFSLYERRPHARELLMDGIAVRQDMRGHGIGTKLLAVLKQYAHEHQYCRIRLDVIDTNTAAKRLYEREGFVAIRTQHFRYLRWLLGFSAATTMIFQIPQNT